MGITSAFALVEARPCKSRTQLRQVLLQQGLTGESAVARRAAASLLADRKYGAYINILIRRRVSGRGGTTSTTHDACNCFRHRACVGAILPRDVERRAVRDRGKQHRRADGQ